jgi:hypothetical protein
MILTARVQQLSRWSLTTSNIPSVYQHLYIYIGNCEVCQFKRGEGDTAVETTTTRSSSALIHDSSRYIHLKCFSWPKILPSSTFIQTIIAPDKFGRWNTASQTKMDYGEGSWYPSPSLERMLPKIRCNSRRFAIRFGLYRALFMCLQVSIMTRKTRTKANPLNDKSTMGPIRQARYKNETVRVNKMHLKFNNRRWLLMTISRFSSVGRMKFPLLFRNKHLVKPFVEITPEPNCSSTKSAEVLVE